MRLRIRAMWNGITVAIYGLRQYSGWMLLFIVVVAILAALSITQLESPPLSVFLIVVFGVAVMIGCLFVFPYAEVWEGHKPTEARDYNSTRNMLIAVVGGAFTLSTLYFTFRSAEESSRSARETKAAAETQAQAERERQAREEVGQAVTLLAAEEPVTRTAGLYVLDELLKRNAISQPLAYKLVALYVKTNSTSPFKKTGQDWRALSDDARRARADSPTVGIGSLTKRAGDIQYALGVLSEHDKVRAGSVLFTPRIDLRDLHLEGAALGHARLQGTLFSGAHLDFLDVRTSSAPYASFQMADFQGATLFGAYLNDADLTGAKLSTPRNADGSLRVGQTTLLRYASLRRADLTGADLSGADLDHADLRDATLRDANLTEAELDGARLDGADLTRARLAAAKLRGATYDLTTTWPDDHWVTGMPDGDQRTIKLCRVKACLVSGRVVRAGVAEDATS